MTNLFNEGSVIIGDRTAASPLEAMRSQDTFSCVDFDLRWKTRSAMDACLSLYMYNCLCSSSSKSTVVVVKGTGAGSSDSSVTSESARSTSTVKDVVV